MLAMTIYVAAPQKEPDATIATSYIPIINAPVTRAANDYEEVDTAFPNTSHALGSGITTGHIGHPLFGAECSLMSRLNT